MSRLRATQVQHAVAGEDIALTKEKKEAERLRSELNQIKAGQAEMERQRGRQEAQAASAVRELGAARAEAEAHRARRAKAEAEVSRLRATQVQQARQLQQLAEDAEKAPASCTAAAPAWSSPSELVREELARSQAAEVRLSVECGRLEGLVAAGRADRQMQRDAVAWPGQLGPHARPVAETTDEQGTGPRGHGQALRQTFGVQRASVSTVRTDSEATTIYPGDASVLRCLSDQSDSENTIYPDESVRVDESPQAIGQQAWQQDGTAGADLAGERARSQPKGVSPLGPKTSFASADNALAAAAAALARAPLARGSSSSSGSSIWNDRRLRTGSQASDSGRSHSSTGSVHSEPDDDRE